MSGTLASLSKISAVSVYNVSANYFALAGTTSGKIFRCAALNPALGTGNIWTDITPTFK